MFVCFCFFIITESVLTSCITCWFENVPEAHKRSARRIVNAAGKPLRITLPKYGMYIQTLRNVNNHVSELRHPLTTLMIWSLALKKKKRLLHLLKQIGFLNN